MFSLGGPSFWELADLGATPERPCSHRGSTSKPFPRPRFVHSERGGYAGRGSSSAVPLFCAGASVRRGGDVILESLGNCSTFFSAVEDWIIVYFCELESVEREHTTVPTASSVSLSIDIAAILPSKDVYGDSRIKTWTSHAPETGRRVRATAPTLATSCVTDKYRRTVTFIDKEGESHSFQVADGDNLLDIAQDNDLEMEGACGGSCACSTCHVIVESDHYDKMEEPDDDENDMLDLAFGLTETSRLGCQVKMSKELDGLVVRLPSMTRNMQASDFK